MNTMFPYCCYVFVHMKLAKLAINLGFQYSILCIYKTTFLTLSSTPLHESQPPINEIILIGICFQNVTVHIWLVFFIVRCLTKFKYLISLSELFLELE